MTGWAFCLLYFIFFVQAMGCGVATASEVTLLYTGSTQSFLEMCGCAEGQLGGVARRATAVRDLKHNRSDVLLLDAGDLFEGNTPLDRLRCLVHLNAMKSMGYDVANAGVDVFRFGRAFFESVRDSVPFVSANLRLHHKAVLPAYHIFDREGIKIGVIGIAGQQMAEVSGNMGMGKMGVIPAATGVDVASVATVLQGVVTDVKKRADVVVVLSTLDRATERELAKSISGVDVVISTRSSEILERVDGVVLLGTHPQGKAVGRAVLTWDGGRVADVTAMPVWMSEQVDEDLQIKKMVDGFYAQVNDHSELQQVGRPRFEGFALETEVVAGKNGYVGASACQSCHESEYDQWSKTHHAGAFQTLVQKQKHYQPDCVTCHTTGFGFATGFRIGAGQSALGGVQCEVCHGPGGRHALRPEAKNIRKIPPKDLCQRCHDQNQTPDLDARFSDMLAHVNHTVSQEHPVSAAHAVQTAVGKTQGKPLVELFVMADCPYGMRAETMLAPVIRMMGDQIDFKLYFIADEVGVETAPVAPVVGRQSPGCSGTVTSGSGRFRSLHGDPEVHEGMRQMAAMQLYPDRYWDYILCRNEHGITSDWRACAVQSGLDADRIAALAESVEGENLFSQNIRRANVLGITASPTLWVNGKEVAVHFDPVGFTRLLCQNGAHASLCAQTPICGHDSGHLR
jgi:hypothetical protein